MATKSVADKLLIKPGTSVWVSHGDRLGLIGELPAGVKHADDVGSASTAILFADDAASIRTLLQEHRGNLASPENLWVLYPKGNRADINRDTLWPIVAEHGLRPITQVSVDDTWSALRFRPLRDGELPFTGGG
jgi:hypothetical protein